MGPFSKPSLRQFLQGPLVSTQRARTSPDSPLPALQRIPVIPEANSVRMNLPQDEPLDEFLEAYDEFKEQYVFVPMSFFEVYADDVSEEDEQITAIPFHKLLGVLVKHYPAADQEIGLFLRANSVAARLESLGRLVHLIDSVLGEPLWEDPQWEDPEEEEPQEGTLATAPCEVTERFLIVRFPDRASGKLQEVRASLLRHGLWSMDDATPKPLNSVLLPGVIGALEADGCELSKQLAQQRDWFGRGCFYKVSSGRVYEVDLVESLLPGEGSRRRSADAEPVPCGASSPEYLPLVGGPGGAGRHRSGQASREARRALP